MNELNKPLLLVLILVAIAAVFMFYYIPARTPHLVATPTASTSPNNVPQAMIDAMKIRTAAIISRQEINVAALPADLKLLVHSGSSYLKAERTVYADRRTGYFISYLLTEGDFKLLPDQLDSAVVKSGLWFPLNSAWSPGYAYFEIGNSVRQARVTLSPLKNDRIGVAVEAVNAKK